MQETTVLANNKRVLLGRVKEQKNGKLKMVPYFRKNNENIIIKNVKNSRKTDVGSLVCFAINRDDGDHSSYDAKEPIQTSHYDTYRGNVHGVVSVGTFMIDPRAYMGHGFFKEKDNGSVYYLKFSDRLRVAELMAQSAAEGTPLVCYHEDGKMIRLEMAY